MTTSNAAAVAKLVAKEVAKEVDTSVVDMVADEDYHAVPRVDEIMALVYIM